MKAKLGLAGLVLFLLAVVLALGDRYGVLRTTASVLEAVRWLALVAMIAHSLRGSC
jgi:hypothetical protein